MHKTGALILIGITAVFNACDAGNAKYYSYDSEKKVFFTDFADTNKKDIFYISDIENNVYLHYEGIFLADSVDAAAKLYLEERVVPRPDELY